MLDDLVVLARAAMPQECVGFIGTRDGVTGDIVIPAHNHAPNPRTHFFVEPQEIHRIIMAMVERSAVPLALYHSHIDRGPFPSKTDLQFKSLPMLIVGSVSSPDPNIRAWQQERELRMEIL
jgi:proteasome lid subunit RPN8/RPN11